MAQSKRTKKPAKTSKSSDDIGLKATWRVISQKQKGLMVAMIVLLVMSAVMLVISLTTLRPQKSSVIVGYNDMFGGYQWAGWFNMLAFPIMALVFGVLHNLLAVRVFQKYGRDAALVLVIATMFLVAGALLVIFRLLMEWQ